MCTAISYIGNRNYFGRNLDVDFSFNEQVIVTPRNTLFKMSSGKNFYNRFALIGIAAGMNSYPLYYEASNEAGLAAASLNFPGNAAYREPQPGKINIGFFEFMPYILGQASCVQEARAILSELVITNRRFNENMPLSQVHFLISDKNESIVVEPTAEGLKIYDNPYRVLTNNPPFDFHLWNIHNYLNLSPKNRESSFSSEYELKNSGVGMGAAGLPGDTSSPSRFIRAAFNLTNSPRTDDDNENVAQFFHILDSVAMLRGSTLTDAGKDDFTLYSCCIDTGRCILYYKTYGNNRINAVRLTDENMNASALVCYPLCREQDINFQN